MITITLKERLEEKGMTRYRLAQLSGISFPTVDKYYKNKVARYDGYILSQFCAVLDCGVGDLLRYTADGEAAASKNGLEEA